jgi:hypothetical protein
VAASGDRSEAGPDGRTSSSTGGHHVPWSMPATRAGATVVLVPAARSRGYHCVSAGRKSLDQLYPRPNTDNIDC